MESDARPNEMEIDLRALDHNYRLLLSLLRPETRVIASVKGAAYGLGVVEIARRLTGLGVPTLATGTFEDALAIRRAGIDSEIVMFGGALPGAMPAYLEHRLTPTVHNIEMAEAVSIPAQKRCAVYIKID